MLRTLPTYITERDEITDAMFLDANEGYRQWLKVDLAELKDLNRYPDNACHELRQVLRETYVPQFSRDQIIVSSGSMELIDLMIRGFCKKALLINEPSYQVYETKALQCGLPVRKVILQDDFSLDLPALRKHADSADVLLLINPNNPTGNLVSAAELAEILSFFRGIVIVDEAYIEFAGLEHSLASFALEYPNIIVLRSFSKAWGLAGIRLGYALASPHVIGTLAALKNAYNVSVLAQEIGIQALLQQEGLLHYISECLDEKGRLLAELRLRGISVVDTHANFILVKVIDSKALHQRLRHSGILVRDRGHQVLLDNTIRITIGAAHENKRLVDAIEDFLELQYA
jgi:histidinol-phosphate aminotransferase